MTFGAIVNGIDIEMWNPMDDPEIPYHYNKVNVEKQKKENKMALQKELGLQVDPNVMLIGVVSRLTWQKGFYLLMEKLNELCAAPIQLAVLGSGEPLIEEKMRQLEDGNKGKIVFYRGYNESLAHRIYAGSDLCPDAFAVRALRHFTADLHALWHPAAGT